MQLASMAAYFARTPLEGLSGSTWVPAVAYGTLLPYDRFISPRSAGNLQRHLLIHPDVDIPAQYTVLRIDGQIYLKGQPVDDVFQESYSRVYLLHLALYTISKVELMKTTSASGVASIVTPTVVGTLYGHYERVTFNDSREYSTVRFPEVEFVLPSNTSLNVDHVLRVGADEADVREVFPHQGFTHVRALLKKPS